MDNKDVSEKVAWAKYYEFKEKHTVLESYREKYVRDIMESDAPYDVKNYTLLYHRECLITLELLSHKDEKSKGPFESFWFSGKLYVHQHEEGNFKVYVEEKQP